MILSGKKVRYALYYAPEKGSPLDQFAQQWLQRTPDQWVLEPLSPLNGLSPKTTEHILKAPRHYGFHGTLKAPFYLAENCRADYFIHEIKAFALNERSFYLPPLKLSRLGDFLALIPSEKSPGIIDLASRVVRYFDPFRRSAAKEELALRRAKGLSSREEILLERWGYPYVMEAFRFHLTLTSSIREPDLKRKVFKALTHLLKGLDLRCIPVCGLSLFIQRSQKSPFVLHGHYSFGDKKALGKGG